MELGMAERTRWEYCQARGYQDITVIHYYRNVSGAPSDDGVSDRWIWQALAQLGEEGWELVSVSQSVYYLKRPLS